ncbi:ATP-binding protein [Azonexus sp.]|uniref:ATP-binding protein n=1 Tax=Azonexus sp. TaxID=1872668 RepID=UPI0035AE8844
MKLPDLRATTWLRVLLILLGGWLLAAAIEHIDHRQGERAAMRATELRLQSAALRLEKTLKQILQVNYDFAAALPADYAIDEARLRPLAERLVASHPRLINITLSRQMEVVFVHPFAGNEAVFGMNYANRPYIMAGVERAMAARDTVLTGPVKLVQNQRLGLVGRTPVHFAAGDGKAQVFQGIVSCAIDFEGVLADAGLLDPAPAFSLAIRGRDGSGAQGDPFFGDPALFKQPHVAIDLDLPGGQWRLVAVPTTEASPLRNWTIRGIIALLTLLLAVRAGAGNGSLTGIAIRLPARRQIGLRGFLLGALFLVLLPIIGISGWIAYRNAGDAADQFTRSAAESLSQRAHNRVSNFFEVPRRVVAFNVERARAGLLDTGDRPRMMQDFLLQIRQQPLLTFISAGMTDGEYYAGSRPPLGPDKGLRLLYARRAEQRIMQIHRVDDAARRTTLVGYGNDEFDARSRPWFIAARDSGRMAWYSPYRYVINDQLGAYDTMGIGMSAPLHDPAGSFIGVTTADVALSQLSTLLRELTDESGGIAFLVDRENRLLASSTSAPIHNAGQRFRLADSADPLLQATGPLMLAGGAPEGSRFFASDGERHLLDWHTIVLENGPALSIGVILPQSRFDMLTAGMLRNLAYLGLVIGVFGIVVGLLATDWVSRPLARLARKASRMAAGDWQTEMSAATPIREVRTLSSALADMARQLQRHTEHLERQAAELRSGNERLQAEVAERMKSEAHIQALNVDLEIANQTLLIAKEAADSASKAKSAFLANMSHELRTPMHGIMGMVSLVRARVAEPKLQHQLDRAMEAASRLLLILNEILDLSKIEADRLTLDRVEFKLAPVLDNVAALLAHKAADKGLRLDIQPLPTAAGQTFVGDALRLGQVLINLAGNAVKFTERGSITIAADLVSETADAALLRFTIRDTGIGIAPDVQQRLFNAFEQADSSTTRKYGGTGLGLAICKRLVAMMGGEIGVDSQPGVGSTFWFTLRLGRTAQEPPALPAATDDSEVRLRQHHAGARILLAEDEPINQEVTRELLEQVALVVDLAENGEMAVSMAGEQAYELILMDMQMPLLNGLDATRAIRAGGPNQRTPILAMTANAFSEDRQRCLEAGMNDHVGKPVDPDQLYRHLLHWLEADKKAED